MEVNGDFEVVTISEATGAFLGFVAIRQLCWFCRDSTVRHDVVQRWVAIRMPENRTGWLPTMFGL